MSPVLLVDDDVDVRESLADLLQLEGYPVATARDGQDALDRLHGMERPLPKLILLDLMMPNMNGWEFRQAQLMEPELMQIPVVVISAGMSPGMHRLADDFMGKPFDMQRLLKIVQRYVH